MKISKTAAAASRRIFRLCQTGGRLDETKLSSAIRKIAEAKPRDYRGILLSLKRLIRLEAESRQVTIESATELDSATRERVSSGLIVKYGNDLSFSYKITPELLGGLKVQVGNDVWDGSVKGRIDRLAQAF
jgi:F-type H+-transporting ATPase subunit delta